MPTHPSPKLENKKSQIKSVESLTPGVLCSYISFTSIKLRNVGSGAWPGKDTWQSGCGSTFRKNRAAMLACSFMLNVIQTRRIVVRIRIAVFSATLDKNVSLPRIVSLGDQM